MDEFKKIFETLRDQIEYGIDNIRASKNIWSVYLCHWWLF